MLWHAIFVFLAETSCLNPRQGKKDECERCHKDVHFPILHFACSATTTADERKQKSRKISSKTFFRYVHKHLLKMLLQAETEKGAN